MAKKRKKKRASGAAALKTTVKLEPQTGPVLSVGATICLSASIYNVRERVIELAQESVGSDGIIPTTGVVLALAQLGLNWASETDAEADAAK